MPPATPEHSSEPPHLSLPAAIQPTPHTTAAPHATPLGTEQQQVAALASTPHTGEEASRRHMRAAAGPLVSGGQEGPVGVGVKHGSTSGKKRRSDGPASTRKHARQQAGSGDHETSLQQADAGPDAAAPAPGEAAADAETPVQATRAPKVPTGRTGKVGSKKGRQQLSMSTVRKGKSSSQKQKQRTSL